MKRILLLTALLIIICANTNAAQGDTVLISPANVNTAVLKPGTHRWLVYFKMGKDSSRSRYQVWTRKIDMISYNGRDAIAVTQEWENNDTVFHKVYSVCDKHSFAPLYQDTWNRGAGTAKFDFLNKQAWVNDKPIGADSDSMNAKRYKAFESSFVNYVLNWHLDLEVFPILPYKPNTTFAINFYDPGFPAPKVVYYTVTGSGTLTGYDGQTVDCWLLEHNDNDRIKNHEVFYISKKTKEVLQLDQQFGTRYRYKVKLPFSN